MKIIERIFDAVTGETNDFERDATADEIAAFEKAKLDEAEAIAKAEQASAAKAALLEKLGITEEEAKLLLS